MLRKLLLSMTVLGVLALFAVPAAALDNDLKLSRFAEFNPREYGNCESACGSVRPDTELFEALVRDFGQVIAPRLANPAETLGEAGFAVNMMTSWSLIDKEDEHWKLGLEDRNPEPVFFTGHLQIRKGLPFSFEIAGNLAYVFASEMFTLGADVKWALNEGFKFIPDLALRGSVNTLMGSRDLNLYTAGGDISVSKAFGIAGILVVTPYVGAQGLWLIGSSRLLNAYPQDPRPPQFDEQQPPFTEDDPNDTFAPEFVFSQYTDNVYRFFVGTRVNVWILNLVVDAVFADITQITLAGGVDF